jgi:hypothetical protein
LGVDGGDALGGVGVVVEQGGQDPEPAAPGSAAFVFDVEVELDQPGDGVAQAGQAVFAGFSAPPHEHAVGLVQPYQVRPVGQGSGYLAWQVGVAVLDPPGQVCAGGGGGQESGHGEEVAVGEVEGAGPQLWHEGVEELLLAGGV